MLKLPYYIVDVFAISKYTGNQLAVVIDATQSLSEQTMQQIAKEINYSETTFITATEPADSGFGVRIFTPTTELPFAGHPTLGTAYIIKQEGLTDQAQIILNLKVGQIPVTIENHDLWMKQNNPIFTNYFDIPLLASILNLSADQFDEQFPIVEVSTGIPFIIVPLKNLTALKSAKLNLGLYYQLIESTNAKSILIFSQQTYHPDQDLSVRVFTQYYGIPEDPATGSANGCLAGYLAKYGYLGSNIIDIKVGQGYEIARPSLLKLRSHQISDHQIEVFVGGQVIPIAQGILL